MKTIDELDVLVGELLDAVWWYVMDYQLPESRTKYWQEMNDVKAAIRNYVHKLCEDKDYADIIEMTVVDNLIKNLVDKQDTYVMDYNLESTRKFDKDKRDKAVNELIDYIKVLPAYD